MLKCAKHRPQVPEAPASHAPLSDQEDQQCLSVQSSHLVLEDHLDPKAENIPYVKH